MLLKEYLLVEPSNNLALLFFNKKGELQCELIDNIKEIDSNMLNKEVMDINTEEDRKEIWIK